MMCDDLIKHSCRRGNRLNLLKWEDATELSTVRGRHKAGKREIEDQYYRLSVQGIAENHYQSVQFYTPKSGTKSSNINERELPFVELNEQQKQIRNRLNFIDDKDDITSKIPPLDINIALLAAGLKRRERKTIEILLPDVNSKLEGHVRWEVHCRMQDYVIKKIARVLDEITMALNTNTVIRLLYLRIREGRYYFDREQDDCTIINVQKCLSGAKSTGRTFESIVEVLKICLETLKNNVIITKRSLFYKGVNTFKTQNQSDRIIDLVAMNLAISRCCLNITASPKGVVYGDITFVTKSGEIIHCNKFNESGVGIPCLGNIASYSYVAKFVLVVEKATIFAELVSSEFVRKYGPCIIVSGGGYPDTRTKSLINHLSRQKRLMLYALTDLDPYGIDIYLCYKYGPRLITHYNGLLTCPTLKWIDISSVLQCTHDLENFKSSLIPIKKVDVVKGISMLRNRRVILRFEKSAKRSLQLLLLQGHTHEIELYTLDTLVESIIVEQIKPKNIIAIRHSITLTDNLSHE